MSHYRKKPSNDGGCDFAARPGLSAAAQSILWSPLVDPAILLVTKRPTVLPSTPLPPHAAIDAGHDSPEGRHALDPTILTQLLFLNGTTSSEPFAALIPFDDDTLDRIEAVTRAYRAWYGRTLARDTRVTPDQRRRLRLKLQAADGRLNGASYRQIAIAIFGELRVSAEPWKTSSLRDMVIELVEGGFDLIAGGYLKLLRHRRRS